jgi:hypothetical protein
MIQRDLDQAIGVSLARFAISIMRFASSSRVKAASAPSASALPAVFSFSQPSVGGARIAQARACRRGIYERRIRVQIERIWGRRQDAGRTPLIGD